MFRVSMESRVHIPGTHVEAGWAWQPLVIRELQRQRQQSPGASWLGKASQISELWAQWRDPSRAIEEDTRCELWASTATYAPHLQTQHVSTCIPSTPSCRVKKQTISWLWSLISVLLPLGMLKQENCWEFDSSLG